MSDGTPQPLHPAGLDPDELLKQCTVRRYKASGPGGQHRNKVETAVELTHSPTGIVAAAAERRSQHDNLCMALKRLRLKLAIEHRCKADLAKLPSDLWQSRIKDHRVAISVDHSHFPTLLAEALDILTVLDQDYHKAAVVLKVSPSQFVKFLQKAPKAIAKVNQDRIVRGMRELC